MAEQGFEVICLLCNPISISNPVRHVTLSSHEPGDPERERGRRWGRHIAGVRVSRRPRAELHHIKPYFLSLIVLMLSKCHYVWHGSQSLRDCSTVLSLYRLQGLQMLNHVLLLLDNPFGSAKSRPSFPLLISRGFQ